MTPPNITKGEWILQPDGTIWTEDGKYILAETKRPYGGESPIGDWEANARFLSASKAMAEALLKAMVTLSIEGSERTLGVTSWRSSRFHAAYLDARRALLQAGYTEDPSHS